MPTHFYDNAYYLHHLPKAATAAKTIQTGNGPVKTHFWIDILLNVQGCMLQFKLLVCDTQAQTGILLSKMALEQLQTWQDYSNNTLYVKKQLFHYTLFKRWNCYLIEKPRLRLLQTDQMKPNTLISLEGKA